MAPHRWNGPRRTTKCIRHCRVRLKVVDLVQEQRYAVGTGTRLVGLAIPLRCIYKPSLAVNGSYISVSGNLLKKDNHTMTEEYIKSKIKGREVVYYLTTDEDLNEIKSKSIFGDI